MDQAAQDSPVLRVLDRLERVRRTGAGWTARCPAHADRKPSLSVTETDEGKVLLNCHAGCPADAVIGALGLKWVDLFPPDPSRENGHAPRIVRGGPPPPGRSADVTYDYLTAGWELSFQVVRYAPKDFRQRRPDGRGGWEWKGGNLDLPYRLPELLAAPADAWVFVVEGEKDADALWRLGLVATCNAGGAGKWRAAHAEALAGRRVAVLPDNDEPGRAHGLDVARSLVGTAAAMRLVTLPDVPLKGDVSDWLAAGGTADGLVHLAEETTDWQPVGLLRFLSAADLFPAEVPVIPWMVSSPEGGGLLAERDVLILASDSGLGKSWVFSELLLALTTGTRFLGRFRVGREYRVLLIDEESPLYLLQDRWPRLLRGRDLALDAFLAGPWTRMRFLHDQGFSFDREDALRELTEKCLEWRPDLVLFDTLARIHRRAENDNSEVAALFSERIRPFARSVGCALGFAHHARKASKDAPNDAGALLRGASDLKAQLDELWFLRGVAGQARLMFEHAKCRPAEPQKTFNVSRERTDGEGVALLYEGDLGSKTTLTDQAKDVIYRALIDTGETPRQALVEFGKKRGFAQRTTDDALAALLEEGLIERRKAGKAVLYAPSEEAAV